MPAQRDERIKNKIQLPAGQNTAHWHLPHHATAGWPTFSKMKHHHPAITRRTGSSGHDAGGTRLLELLLGLVRSGRCLLPFLSGQSRDRVHETTIYVKHWDNLILYQTPLPITRIAAPVARSPNCVRQSQANSPVTMSAPKVHCQENGARHAFSTAHPNTCRVAISSPKEFTNTVFTRLRCALSTSQLRYMMSMAIGNVNTFDEP